MSALKQGSPEWHAWRMAGIGGSDAPVVYGNSPYRTPRELYFEKIGQPLPDENEGKEFIFARGHAVEGLIRRQFQELTGVEMMPVCLVHPELEYVRASLDGFDPKLGVLEAKLVGQDALEKARAGFIPDHHMTQMQHQFAVSGADVGQWFGHDGKKSGVLVEVRADAAYIAKLLRLENTFWARVQQRLEPELSDRDYIFSNDPLLLELRDAKEFAENAQARYEQLKERAIAGAKHSRIAAPGMKFYKTVREGAVNIKSVPEVKSVLDHLGADYLDQFRGKPVESWTLKVEGRKKVSA